MNVERDYFTDLSVLTDPYEYFREMFAKGPVTQTMREGVLMVTGYEEAIEVLRNAADFSSVISAPTAAYPLPFTPEGDDISEQIEAHRSEIPSSNLLVTFDGAAHTAGRSLYNRLFMPSRLKANEEYMAKLAEQYVRKVVKKGQCELVDEVSTSYVTLVIADLLGVPDDDRELFRSVLDATPVSGNMKAGDAEAQVSPLEYMAGFFHKYLTERRAAPRNDILTELATATYPDGTPAGITELVTLASLLFGAGQDTSAKLLSTAMRYLTEIPGIQQTLRENRHLIADFLEEVLRLEGSTKATFRLARRKTRIGNMEIPAGTKLVVSLAAANRDPRRWEDPNAFKLNRPKVREHLAFGRGAHVCIGAPLARAELRSIIDSFLEHTSDIRLSEAQHGPPGNRRFDFVPSYIIRGMSKLYMEFTPR